MEQKTKISKKQLKHDEKVTEVGLAQSLGWDEIIEKISIRRKEIKVIDDDIRTLIDKKRRFESDRSKYVRILNFKKKLGGA